MTDATDSSFQSPDNAEDPNVEYEKCQALLGEEDVDGAIACLENIVKKHPDYAIAFNDLGVLSYQKGDKKRCVQWYEQALAIDPENLNIKKNLADFYLVEQGRMEEAMEIYLSVLTKNPEDIDVLMAAGHICNAMGKKDSAETFYERILDLEPWNFDANDRLERLRNP